MSKTVDSLPTAMEDPDRVYFETGVLLNAEDFRTEQDYHRARLARALAFVVGSGTVAGLKVIHEPRVEPAADDENGMIREEQLKIAPGLAIDPLGRMIEVPRHICIRIDRWYQAQSNQDLRVGWNETDAAWNGSTAGVTVDLRLEFVPCERGKTPSFAKGPIDSLDAVAPSRIRDGYEYNLTINKEHPPKPPPNPWPDFSAAADAEQKIKKYRDAIFEAWEKSNASGPTSVFIARIVIAATEATGEQRPQRTDDNKVDINNRMRPFVFSTNGLARLLEIDLTLGEE